MTEPHVDREGAWINTIIGVAGLAGCGVAALIVLYRDVLAGRFLSNLSSDHSAVIVGLVVLGTFFIAVLAIFTWLARNENSAIAQRAYVFLALVFVLVGSVLMALWLVAPPVEEESALKKGIDEFRQGNFQVAQQYFESAEVLLGNQPEPSFWLARVALERNQLKVAEKLLALSSQRDPRYRPAHVLKVILDVMQSDDRNKTIEENKNTIIVTWLRCAKDKNVFTPALLSPSQISDDCPILN